MAQQDILAFIGGGNMASSLIGGLIKGGHPAPNIRVADPNEGQRLALADRFPGIFVTKDNSKAARQATCIVLTVKPQMMEQAISTLGTINENPLFLSVAAGLTSTRINQWLGGKRAIVRAMPNLPALIGYGVTGAYANNQTHPSQRAMAEYIIRTTGELYWFDDEVDLNAVTALSGSGPAYIFLIIEALEAGGISLGLTPKTARALALHTTYGAARLALQSGESPATLRTQVTSPGGTTEQAIRVFEQGGLRELVAEAMRAAVQRACELAET